MTGLSIRRFGALALCLSSVAALAEDAPSPKAPIHVHAAGSLGGALPAIAARYERETGGKVDFVFGPSGLLREGIEKGSEADLFLSADTHHPERLADEGRAFAPVVFVRNALCVSARPDHAPTSETLLDVMLDPATKIGMSTPKADPGGDYALALFAKAETAHKGAERALTEKARSLVGGTAPAPTGSSRPAASGAKKLLLDEIVDLFIGYCSRRETHPDPDLASVIVPEPLAVRADYALAVVRDKTPERQAAAADFARYLATPQAQAIFADYNFVPLGAALLRHGSNGLVAKP